MALGFAEVVSEAHGRVKAGYLAAED